MCTLTGTSTNLVVHGAIIDNGFIAFNMFELGKIGLIVTADSTIFISIAGNLFLPGKKIIFTAKSSSEYKDYSYDIIKIGRAHV